MFNDNKTAKALCQIYNVESTIITTNAAWELSGIASNKKWPSRLPGPTKPTLATRMNSTLVTVLAFKQLTSLFLRGEPIPFGQLKCLEMLKAEAAQQNQLFKKLL